MKIPRKSILIPVLLILGFSVVSYAATVSVTSVTYQAANGWPLT